MTMSSWWIEALAQVVEILYKDRICRCCLFNIKRDGSSAPCSLAFYCFQGTPNGGRHYQRLGVYLQLTASRGWYAVCGWPSDVTTFPSVDIFDTLQQPFPHRWHSRQSARPLHARPSLDYTMNSSRYYHMLTFLVEAALHNCIYIFLCLPGTSELTLFIHKPSKLTCGILICCIFHDHKPILSIRKITQKWSPQRLLKYEENM